MIDKPKIEEAKPLDAVAQFSSLLGYKEKEYIIPADEFLTQYCYTLDPHDFNNPIKKFPDHEYIHYLCQAWLDNRLLGIVKSRQMMATWVFVALNLWLAMFHRGQYVFFISRKESDAGLDSPLSLLSRAWFIWTHLPDHLKLKSPCSKSACPPILRFTNYDSVIHGVSQDSDALRQYTASSVFNDEMAFQEKSRESYAAMKPTIDGGGRLTCVSTPNGKSNLFYELINDIQR